MKNILICLERLDIGGVETAVVNQALAMKRLGNNVTILSKRGIYSKRLEDNGIKCIEVEFIYEDILNLEKVNLIEETIKEYNIDQVHIHQMPCFLSAPIACMMTKVPYIIYLHSERIDPYEWFVQQYKLYDECITDIFNNAYKIVAITEKSKDNHMQYFKIPESKYIVRKNSINFDDFKNSRTIDKISNFLIVSRLDEEKRESIVNGIDLFIRYNDLTKSNAKLNIVGDGTIREEIEKYAKEKNINNYDIEFLGASNNIAEIINESDVVIAIGRCILEAIAMKRIAIISGLEHLKLLITPENVEKATDGNYIGRYFEDKTNENICQELIKLSNDKEKIDAIVEQNYNYIKEILDINKNIYYITDDVKDYYIKDEQIIRKLLNVILKLQESLKSKSEEANEIWKAKLYLEGQVKELGEIKEKYNLINEELSKETEELNKIYSGKIWKFLNKIRRYK